MEKKSILELKMFEASSRYAHCEDAKLTVAVEKDEHVIVYKKRRFIPSGERMDLFQDTVVVVGGDRLDLIARSYARRSGAILAHM